MEKTQSEKLSAIVFVKDHLDSQIKCMKNCTQLTECLLQVYRISSTIQENNLCTSLNYTSKGITSSRADCTIKQEKRSEIKPKLDLRFPGLEATTSWGNSVETKNVFTVENSYLVWATLQ